MLIVEDDRAARRAIGAILRAQGFAVSEVTTVADALRALCGSRASGGSSPQPPDWIVLDLMLPDGCGIDIVRKVRAEHLASKVCVVTGCGSEMLCEAERAGAEHAFTKPLDVQRLMTVMSE